MGAGLAYVDNDSKIFTAECQCRQFEELEAKGSAHGKHFSLQSLIDTLRMYVDNEKIWDHDQRARDYWCKMVGGTQKALPAHVVNEYCRGDRSFEPCPQEWESKLPRTRELEIWDGEQDGFIKCSWYVPLSSQEALGRTYGFFRYSNICVSLSVCAFGILSEGVILVFARETFIALQSLWKTRTRQLELLGNNLKQKSLVIETLQFVGLFAEGIRLVCDYAEQTDNEFTLGKFSDTLFLFLFTVRIELIMRAINKNLTLLSDLFNYTSE